MNDEFLTWHKNVVASRYRIFMPPPTCIGEGGNMHPVVMSVVLSVVSVINSFCDSVHDNPRISGIAEARDFKFCVLIEGKDP